MAFFLFQVVMGIKSSFVIETVTVVSTEWTVNYGYAYRSIPPPAYATFCRHHNEYSAGCNQYLNEAPVTPQSSPVPMKHFMSVCLLTLVERIGFNTKPPVMVMARIRTEQKQRLFSCFSKKGNTWSPCTCMHVQVLFFVLRKKRAK